MSHSEQQKPTGMNILDVLAVGLKASGYDGLVINGCACLVDDLSPGGCLGDNCQPGYKHTHSVTGDWCVSTRRAPLTDDEIERGGDDGFGEYHG